MEARALVESVREFHELIGRPTSVLPIREADYVKFTGQVLEERAKHCLDYFKKCDDLRYLRAHLLLEELGELCIGMGECDELRTLDALADLLYVLLGTAIELDLPIIEAFVEVHRSNMTKRRQSADPDSVRVRDKGPDYVAPDLRRVLDTYRAHQVAERVVNAVSAP